MSTTAAYADHLTPAEKRTLAHVRALAKVLDESFEIPLVGYKFGLESIVGVVPYAGDMLGAAAGSYIVTRALKYNLPKRLVFRMMLNQGIDFVVGCVPFFGDIFDMAHKANSRNVKLLEAHLTRPKQARMADTCLLFWVFMLVVVLPALLVAGIVVAIVVGVLAAVGKL